MDTLTPGWARLASGGGLVGAVVSFLSEVCRVCCFFWFVRRGVVRVVRCRWCRGCGVVGWRGVGRRRSRSFLRVAVRSLRVFRSVCVLRVRWLG